MKQTSEQIAEGMEAIGVLVGAVAKNAAHIAHARRELYEAYVAEGFTEGQALELCRSLGIT